MKTQPDQAVNVPGELVDRLKELGKKLDRSVRWQVIQAINDYLKEQGA